MQIDKDTLPKGWIKTTLNTVCVSIRDGTHTPPVRTDKGVPLLSGRNIENYGLNWDEKFSYISNHNFKQITKNNTISKNDILLTIVGTIGRVCVVETNSPFTVQRSVAILKLKNFIEPMFAKLYIQSPMFQQTLQRSAKGVAQKGVYLTELKAFEFMYPESLNEQQRISAQIESIFGEIDACRKRLEALQTKSGTGSLAQLKSSVLKQAFEGKLVPQDPNDEPASTLLEKIHSDIEFSFEKSQLPKGWLETKINYTSELIGGGTPSRKNLEYFDGDIVWLTPTEIPKYKITKVSNSREKITKLGLQKSSAKLIPKDAVLLTSRASVGYVAIAGTQVTTNQGFASFVCNDSTFNYYLAYWLWDNSAFLKENATGTTFKEIPKSKLRELKIPLPPLPEQRRIVSKIESIFAKIDALDTHIKSTLQSLDMLKQSTLKLAFEGNLVSQDPKDEPADKLLEQIQQSHSRWKPNV